VKERNPAAFPERMSPFAFVANDRSPPPIAMGTVAISNGRLTSILLKKSLAAATRC
jgi:hypothetical protein